MLNTLTNSELETRLRSLISREREVLQEIILHIQEVSRRKLYLARGRPNLFEYLTAELGYSAASAQRRIEAARLAEELPEVLEKIQSGALNLSQIALAQKAFRQAEATPEKKQQLLQQIEGLSTRESEGVLVKALALPAIRRTKVNQQSDGSVRVEMTLTAEQWKAFQRCQELLAHKNPHGDLAQVVGAVCEHYMAKKDPLASKAEATTQQSVAHAQQKLSAPETNFTSPAEPKPTRRRPIPANTRRQIFQRDQGRCQYRDPETGHLCGERFGAEMDHIQEVANGGTNEAKNLRVLCSGHNKWRSSLQ